MANVEIDPKTVDDIVRRWVKEIDLSREREKEWRKDGQEAINLYEAKELANSFNILTSNTETLAPSLYGAMPRPVVSRRFKDPDPVGKAASEASTRVLSYELDTNSEEYDTFDESMKDAVMDALLPGRGVTEYCYHGETSEYGVEGECVYPKPIIWNRFYHGYARRWCDVPWCAVELYLDKEQVSKEFSKEIAANMTYSYEGDLDKDKRDEQRSNENKTQVKTACVYKIWDKRKKEIVWVSPNHPTSILRTDEDELKLTGFYPFPKPLKLLRKAHDLTPTTIYRLYKTQAKELNVISSRLIHLIGACKVRGVYDSTIGAIEEVLKAEENTLIPADQVASLVNTKGLEGAIWLMPLDKIIVVVKELYLAREQCKSVIYEITGISDIIRGQSSPTETLGAQKIKETWVTLRLKNMQKEVQRYVRDSLRIMLEISTKFEPKTWAGMTGLPFATPEEYAQAQQMVEAIKQQVAMMPPPMPGQPPQPPPQLPPEIQAKLQTPQWTQIIEVLSNDLTRQYRVDIETNSTLDVEANEDKELVAELMNAIAQFLNGIGPLVEKGVMPMQAAQAFLLAITKKFRFGEEIEEHILQMKEPKPQDDGKKEQAMMDAQQKEKDRALLAQTEQQKAQAAERGLQVKAQGEEAQRQHDAQLKAQELQAEEQADMRKIAAEREANLAKLSSERETARMQAELDRKTEMEKATLQAAVAIQTAKIAAEASERDSQRQAEVAKDKNEKDAEAAKDANDNQAEADKSAAAGESKKAENESKATSMMGEAMKGILETQKQLVEMLGSEKEITRDDKGKAKGLRMVKKGDNK